MPFYTFKCRTCGVEQEELRSMKDFKEPLCPKCIYNPEAQGTLIPLVVDEGDTILYNKNAHKSEHTIDGKTYILMSVNEVMSIVEGKE